MLLKSIASCALSVFANYFVNHIPFWTIRKFFYILMGMKIGKDARIAMGTVVSKPRWIEIGQRTVINRDCHLDGRGRLIIGDDVTISAYSIIITEAHLPDSGTFDTKIESVVIKDRAWLGMRAMVLNGSVVEENAIIGAGCVFKGCCEKDDIMVGNPARCIRKRKLEKEYRKNYKAFFI